MYSRILRIRGALLLLYFGGQSQETVWTDQTQCKVTTSQLPGKVTTSQLPGKVTTGSQNKKQCHEKITISHDKVILSMNLIKSRWFDTKWYERDASNMGPLICSHMIYPQGPMASDDKDGRVLSLYCGSVDQHDLTLGLETAWVSVNTCGHLVYTRTTLNGACCYSTWLGWRQKSPQLSVSEAKTRMHATMGLKKRVCYGTVPTDPHTPSLVLNLRASLSYPSKRDGRQGRG